MWKTASILVTVVLILLTLGIIMLASTSGVHGETHYDDALYFVKRQFVWLLLGLLIGLCMSHIDYRVWRQGHIVVPLIVLAVALLAAALIPGIGLTVKGSSRWIRIGMVNLQPSEFAKLVSIMMLAWWMARVQRRTNDLMPGLLIPMGCLCLMLGLIFIEPDFGTTLLVALVGMTIMFVGGARVGYLAIAAVLGLTGFCVAVMRDEERMRRIVAFLNPEKYARDEAFQLLNAIYAFVVGGGIGVGLGQSLQKHFYLPEAHTDFIFAIIGEELGLPASMLVVVLFAAVFFCGIRISLRAPDDFGKLLGFGMTLMITLQAAINIGVVTGCLPTKGLPLPFISFGGSSLVISMTMIGILVNISRHAIIGEQIESRVIKDKAHRF